jgi:type IV secretion system T-DNA border endonuclease VirD2
MVINNRGTVNDSWFFMAKEHAFNLDVMKERMVAIAAEEGVFLDATSRAERGLLTYGPSRAEIERARAEGRAPEERQRESKALEDALATMARTADAMRSLSHVATLTGLPEIGEKIAKAEEALRRGGILQPFLGDVVTAERADLDRHFSGWMAEAEDKIRKMPFTERKEMRGELYGYAIDIAKGLGDARGAQLLQMLPQTKLYATGLEGDRLTQGKEAVELQLGAADRLKTDIAGKAVALGLSGERMTERLETGAANAWEERDWVRSDLLTLSGRRRVDLRNLDQSRKVVVDLEGFYEASAKLIEHARAHEVVPENDRLLRALGSMGRIMQTDGKVEFRGDAHAERFADELRQRYGKGVVAELASGQTHALAGDFEDADERKWIARAIVSSAKSHVAFGLTLKEARHAERLLTSTPARGEHDWER